MEQDQRKHMGSIFSLFSHIFCVWHISLWLCFLLKVLKGMDLGFFPCICMCLFLFCLYVVYVWQYDFSFFFFNCSCKCYINIAAYSVIRHQDCVSINQFPNDDTLEIEGLCLTPTICECMFTVRCVCVCVPCWVFGLVQPQAVCAHPVPSSLVQAAKALVPWTASSCHMAAPSGTRTGQDFLPHGCF